MIDRRLPSLVVAAAPDTGADYSIAEPHTSPGMSPTQILAILMAYRKTSLIIILTCLVLAAAIVKLWPKSYTATATLIINGDNKDPLAGKEFDEGLINSYVATQIEMMLSPIVLMPVVDTLHLTEDRHYYAGFGKGDANALREYVETQLANDLEIDAGRGGHLLYVHATARESARAAEIANNVADVYLDQERRRVNDPAGERATRYSEQLAELKAKANAAQDKVSEYRKRTGVTDVSATNTGTEIQALDTLETRLLEAQNARRSLEAKTAGSTVSTDEALASDPLQGLRSQFGAQKVQLAQLTATLGPQHPKVLELKSQMAVTQAALGAEVENLSENVSTQILRAKQLEAKLAAAVAEQRAKVVQLRELQDEGNKLQLELASAQSVYKKALDGYDQILFASVGNYSNVSFISRAVIPSKASKPNKVKLFLIGVIASLAFGMAGPIAYELIFNRRVRCIDDMERDFGIPVLATFDSFTPGAGAA